MLGAIDLAAVIVEKECSASDTDVTAITDSGRFCDECSANVRIQPRGQNSERMSSSRLLYASGIIRMISGAVLGKRLTAMSWFGARRPLLLQRVKDAIPFILGGVDSPVLGLPCCLLHVRGITARGFFFANAFDTVGTPVIFSVDAGQTGLSAV